MLVVWRSCQRGNVRSEYIDVESVRLLRGLRDLGGNKGMKHMLDYLSEQPEKGLLGYEQLGIGSWVQYWRSFDHLEAFAKDTDDPHLDAWRKYFKRVGKSGRTGIWHETFLVRSREFRSDLHEHAGLRPRKGFDGGACR